MRKMCNWKLLSEILGCPEKLWSLHPWRYSNSDWTWPWATCCSWPCFEQGGTPDDFLRCLPTSAILWFTDSVGWSLKTHLPSVTGIFQVRDQEIIANTIVIKQEGTQLIRKLNFSGSKRELTTVFTRGHILHLRSRKWYHTTLGS